MRKLAYAVIVLNILLASLLMTTTVMLCNLDGRIDITQWDIVHGNIAAFVTSRWLWSIYPSVPHPAAMLSTEALLLMAILTAGGYYWLQIHLKKSPLAVSLFCLASIVLPYGVCKIALSFWTGDDFGDVGRWLSRMLCGMLYAVLASLFFAVWHVAGPQLSLMRRIPDPHAEPSNA